MKVDVLLGLQWGDEGKGKVVDVLTPRYDVVARFQGGPNAGHTLEFEGQKYVLRSIPSGIFQGNKVNIIGNGVVLDPALFKAEAEALEASGHPLKERLRCSPRTWANTCAADWSISSADAAARRPRISSNFRKSPATMPRAPFRRRAASRR